LTLSFACCQGVVDSTGDSHLFYSAFYTCCEKRQGVVAENVTLWYPGADREAISNVSLEVKKGETIAIVGVNGSGKTTLVKLLIGLYLPTQGTVQIAGKDTRNLSPPAIYRGISGVFQKYQKYKMTLGENISISDMAIAAPEQQKITAAAEKADLAMDAKTFPNGYDTMLSREFDGVEPGQH